MPCAAVGAGSRPGWRPDDAAVHERGTPRPGRVTCPGAALSRGVLPGAALPGGAGRADDARHRPGRLRGDRVGVHEDPAEPGGAFGHRHGGVRRADGQDDLRAGGHLRHGPRVGQPRGGGARRGGRPAALRRPQHGVPAIGEAFPDGGAHLAGIQQSEARSAHIYLPPSRALRLVVPEARKAARRSAGPRRRDTASALAGPARSCRRRAIHAAARRLRPLAWRRKSRLGREPSAVSTVSRRTRPPTARGPSPPCRACCRTGRVPTKIKMHHQPRRTRSVQCRSSFMTSPKAIKTRRIC